MPVSDSFCAPTASASATVAAGEQLGRRAILAAAGAGVMAGIAPARADTAATTVAYGAPIVELHFPPGILTPEQKAVLIEGVTDVLLRATGLPADQATSLWVLIVETAEAGWGIGGKVLQPRRK